ncbi:MAG: zinc-binding protein [Nitrospirae bacterium GWB2_47_37]|nr:MAG: zinc-binding protein [Nitrospirae bacterium GWB2_47_37]HAK88274.1 zinc-binding protein [Nitrospiraceae bacterium]
MKSLNIVFILVICLAVMLLSCAKKEEKQPETKKLRIVTTLFPLYDFAKNIGVEYADVSLLLPPGVESHSFEPKPDDIVKINKAGVFIYTGKHMEPWAEKILKGIDNKSLIVVDSSKGINLMKEAEEDGHDHKHGKSEQEMDPHIWLDFGNAQKMVDNMLEGFIKADAVNADAYRKNAAQYKALLSALDNKFREGLASCSTKYFIHGGHYAFGYMAGRYGLNYISAYRGFSPDSEPSAKRLAELVKNMKKHNVKHIFYEELVSPRVADTIAKETGAALLQLHAAHNITKKEWDKGVTFAGLMEQTLANLKIGLQCK